MYKSHVSEHSIILSLTWRNSSDYRHCTCSIHAFYFPLYRRSVQNIQHYSRETCPN